MAKVTFKLSPSGLKGYGLFVDDSGVDVVNDVATADLGKGWHVVTWTLIGNPGGKIAIKILDGKGALIDEVKESKIRDRMVHTGSKYFEL